MTVKSAKILYAYTEQANHLLSDRESKYHMLVHIGPTKEGKMIPVSSTRFLIHKVYVINDDVWIDFSIFDNRKGEFETSTHPLMTTWSEKGKSGRDSSSKYSVMNINAEATKRFGHDIIMAVANFYYKSL